MDCACWYGRYGFLQGSLGKTNYFKPYARNGTAAGCKCDCVQKDISVRKSYQLDCPDCYTTMVGSPSSQCIYTPELTYLMLPSI